MTRLHGIDISHWQGEYNPTENPPNPVDFVVVKFSEGYAPASSAWDMWDGARKAKSAEGYHYWRTAASLQQQIDSVLLAAEDKAVDAIWLDWEPYNNVFTLEQYNRAYEWILEMREHFPLVGLYTNASCWNQMNAFGKQSKYGAWHKTVPFWYARYIYFPMDPFTLNPPLPLECEGWYRWQYGICATYGNQEKGQQYGVQSTTLDVNVQIEQEPTTPENPECDELWAQYQALQDKYTALKALLETSQEVNAEMNADFATVREIAEKYMGE